MAEIVDFARRIRSGATWDEIFPELVERNVPAYLMEKLDMDVPAGKTLAFAASEPGWNGRLSDLRSGSGNTGELFISKSYVMHADTVITLIRHGGGVGLALVPFQGMPGLQSRNEQSAVFDHPVRGRIDHFRSEGTISKDGINILAISDQEYRSVGMQMQRRELVTIAALSGVLLETAGVTIPDSVAQLLDLADQQQEFSGREIRPAQEALRSILPDVLAQNFHPFFRAFSRLVDRFR